MSRRSEAIIKEQQYKISKLEARLADRGDEQTPSLEAPTRSIVENRSQSSCKLIKTTKGINWEVKSYVDEVDIACDSALEMFRELGRALEGFVKLDGIIENTDTKKLVEELLRRDFTVTGPTPHDEGGT